MSWWKKTLLVSGVALASVVGHAQQPASNAVPASEQKENQHNKKFSLRRHISCWEAVKLDNHLDGWKREHLIDTLQVIENDPEGQRVLRAIKKLHKTNLNKDNKITLTDVNLINHSDERKMSTHYSPHEKRIAIDWDSKLHTYVTEDANLFRPNLAAIVAHELGHAADKNGYRLNKLFQKLPKVLQNEPKFINHLAYDYQLNERQLKPKELEKKMLQESADVLASVLDKGKGTQKQIWQLYRYVKGHVEAKQHVIEAENLAMNVEKHFYPSGKGRAHYETIIPSDSVIAGQTKISPAQLEVLEEECREKYESAKSNCNLIDANVVNSHLNTIEAAQSFEASLKKIRAALEGKELQQVPEASSPKSNFRERIKNQANRLNEGLKH